MSVDARPVEFRLEDGAVVRGLRWGDGPDWIILLHEPGEDRDLDDWRPLLPAIMSSERTLLTVDLRGHGASDGESDASLLSEDIHDIVTAVRARGADWIALGGAGRSATEILEMDGSTPVDAMLLLSPVFEPGRAGALRGRGEPKLFAVGSRSASLDRDVREARNRSIGWAMLVSMPTGDQGARLLAGPYNSQLIERIVAFLAEQRTLARTGSPGAGESRNQSEERGEKEGPS